MVVEFWVAGRVGDDESVADVVFAKDANCNWWAAPSVSVPDLRPSTVTVAACVFGDLSVSVSDLDAELATCCAGIALISSTRKASCDTREGMLEPILQDASLILSYCLKAAPEAANVHGLSRGTYPWAGFLVNGGDGAGREKTFTTVMSCK